MASSVCFRTRQLVIVLLFAAFRGSIAEQIGGPRLTSLRIVSVNTNGTLKNVVFDVFGDNLQSTMQIRPTRWLATRNSECPQEPEGKYVLRMKRILPDQAQYELEFNSTSTNVLYFCVHTKTPNDVQEFAWKHQGRNVSVVIGDSKIDEYREEDDLKVYGITMDKSDKQPGLDELGVPEMIANKVYTLRLFGQGFVKNMTIAFTRDKMEYGQLCRFPITKSFSVTIEGDTTGTASVVIPNTDNEMVYICTRLSSDDKNNFIHQGSVHYLGVKVYEKAVPLWAACIIITVCLTFSALFSGLNLGLMSLDRTELKILVNTGTEDERKYAKIITPVRNHGNYLLCSILLGNVFVNSIFTILLDDLTSGVVAVVCSTLAIVMFGEITPQAICSRHGLAVGAKTIYITKMVMGLTAPLSYPISKLLDVILGEEIGNVYNRERLKELVKVTTGENDLDRDEVNIISGALELRKKTVADVMTRIEDAFMLEYDAILDFETVSEIMKSGYSRIPVYEGDRKNIVTTLYIKDLAFVDPDDNTPLKTLCQFYQNPCNFVFEDVTLDIMFKEFKEGNKGHMAFVHRVNSEGEGDPFYETIGLITLEDVIEELIQAEIMDETDVFTDNRSKRRRIANSAKQDFTIFAERKGENNRLRISPQLTLATYQYLSTSVDQFKPNIISETILRRLLKQDIVYHVKKNKDWRNDPTNLIYQQGKSADYFILILEGRVEVTVGRENLVFESGPFTYFGTQALIPSVGIAETPSTMGSLQSLNMDTLVRTNFQPDYSVRACTEVVYLRIMRSLYLAAKRATLMERSQKDSSQIDQFDDEVEKILCVIPVESKKTVKFDTSLTKIELLHSLEEDGSIGRISPPPQQYQLQQPVIVNHQTYMPPGDNNMISHNTSPRTPSLKGVDKSPVVPQLPKDPSIKIQTNPMDDGHAKMEEEVALLPKNL